MLRLLSLLSLMALSCSSGHRYVCKDFLDTGKVETTRYPAVGQIKMVNGECTAVLITPRLVLSASHCVQDLDSFGITTVTFVDGIGRSHLVSSYAGFGDGSDKKTDLALLLLSREIKDIRPNRIAKSFPYKNTKLAFVGYGCRYMCPGEERFEYKETGPRRIVEFPSSELSPFGLDARRVYLCPGDSGGPVINTQTGEVVAIAQGLVFGTIDGHLLFDRSVFADPTLLVELLGTQDLDRLL